MTETLRRLVGAGPLAPALGRPGLLLVLVVVLALAGAGALVAGSGWLTEGQWVPLFAALTPEDAGAIVNQLRAAKTPYRVGGHGEQILVPADRASELRLRLAVQGLPLGGGVGFEVFDKPVLGVSDFAQRLNYQRALQGELARTIGQLREVARARVHLVLPSPSLFADRDRPASASVFVKLQPGAQLGREQVRGIVHLVASSVEGLTPERVTVVDTAGRVLSPGGDGGGGPLSPRRLEARVALEEELERRLQGLLDAAVGSGQAVARVAVQLKLDQVERTEEKYDPNGVARQRTRSSEQTRAQAAPPRAAVGAEQAAPEAGAAAGATSNEGRRESESVTYELSRTVARTVTLPGEIQRLSVAVLLNTPAAVSRGADGKESRQPRPRSQEELDKIRRVVTGAAGIDESRGDQVTVVELPFDASALDRERALLDQPAPPPAAVERRWVTPTTLAVAGGGLVAVAAVAVLLLRGRGRRAAAPAPLSEGEGTPGAAGGPGRAEVLISEPVMTAVREREEIRQKALALAATEPDASAQLLRAWLGRRRPVASLRGGGDGA